mgnify:FL=1
MTNSHVPSVWKMMTLVSWQQSKYLKDVGSQAMAAQDIEFGEMAQFKIFRQHQTKLLVKTSALTFTM